MTSLSESLDSEMGSERALGAAWRARVSGAQEAALPSGRVVVSCSAPFGGGGLGRHLKELVDALDREGAQSAYLSEDPAGSQGSSPATARPSLRATVVAPLGRFSPAWRIWAASVRFDEQAARRLPQAEHLIAFNGTALAQFRAAKRAHWQSASLVSATSHIRRLARQSRRAYEQYPIERPWVSRVIGRNLAEYACADRIYVSSRHIWESFVEEGFREDALSLFPLTPDPRYRRPTPRPTASTFDVVYVGSLSVTKGVPLLVDAFRRLPHRDMRLILLGGWGTRGMRRFIQRACAEDTRIEVRRGDPLPCLQGAGLCVHPTYDDGFAYAPAEALACGVPVVVSEDTGMKELIDPARDGAIVPTGDRGALTDAIDAAYRAELSAG
jgi:glycosyltransferase involved in cell wall biosynthesis